MLRRHLIGKAKVFKVEHDLVWELKVKDRIIRWFGYDDQNWWDKYATNMFYKQIFALNETYEIDFVSGNVYLTISEDDKDYEYEIRKKLRI